MNSASRIPRIDDEAMNDLANAVAEIPEHYRQDLESAYTRLVEARNRRDRVFSNAPEMLGQLRLDVKYLMFDLEVTRDERDELRKSLY